MKKYSLVASFYNPITKKYDNEQEIMIKDVCLNNLAEIDKYTSEYTSEDFYQKLGIREKMITISIKYLNPKSLNPIYMPIIFNNEIISSCVDELESKRFYNYPNYDYAINKRNPYFQSELRSLKKIIETKNLEVLNSLFFPNDKFGNMVKRYILTDYDVNEQNEKKQDLNIIIEEFSRYKNFRRWIVNNVRLDKQFMKDIQCGNLANYDIKTINFNGQDYKNMNEKEYLRYLCQKYNVTEEEFIEPSELAQMGIYQPSIEDYKTKKRKKEDYYIS